jgi:hypothetical protein
VTKNEEEKTIQNGEKMVTKLRDKFVDFDYTLKIKRKLEKPKKKGRCVEEYFEYFCRSLLEMVLYEVVKKISCSLWMY